MFLAIFSLKQCKTFEEAVELSAESLERMLIKERKISSHLKLFFFKNVLNER
jgi:hypothetical protein